MVKKKELGKGIRALLSDIEENEKEKANVVRKLSSHIELINLEDIELNPFQPRKEFDEEQLFELAESIKTYGIIQAITVRDMKDGKYQLISGERRYKASKLAGLKQIPAFIRIADDHLMLEMALVENIQRENLNALEVAISYQRLINEFEFTHEQLSDRVGKKRATITNYIRLLKLPPQIQNAVKSGVLSMGHARALLGIDDLGTQLKIFQQTINQELSVRALEKLILQFKTKPSDSPREIEHIHPEVERIQKRLAEKIGIKPTISRNKAGKGEIRIPFSNDDQLNQIVEAIFED